LLNYKNYRHVPVACLHLLAITGDR
jgi:hypothetical protein